MNILEEIDNSPNYTTLDQYRMDQRDIRYKQLPSFRAAIDRKLERSWGVLQGQATQNFKIGGNQAFATATRDSNGQIRTKVTTDPLGLAADAAPVEENSGRFEIMPGGAVRLTGGGNPRG